MTGYVEPSPDTPVVARKGDRIGWWDGHHFTPASPGRAHQLRCARFVQARADLAGVIIVGYWSA